MVDEGRIALTPAVELSYLTEQGTTFAFERNRICGRYAIPFTGAEAPGLFPSGQAYCRCHFAVMSEEKANQKEQIRFPKEEIQKYFP